MDTNILNIAQAVEFLGVSEKTLIKLLREEHIPARKIGREWRFSKEALINWLSSGDSCNYINKDELYQISEDKSEKSMDLMNYMINEITELMKDKNIRHTLNELNTDIIIPEDANLRISYKQQREIEKLEFKIFWNIREAYKLEPNTKKQ
jgi:excisionase family DNA binding protein